MQVDDLTLGLYYFEDAIEPTLFLEARGANPTTYTKKKVIYIFLLKTNIILDPEVVYKDRYNIELKSAKGSCTNLSLWSITPL